MKIFDIINSPLKYRDYNWYYEPNEIVNGWVECKKYIDNIIRNNSNNNAIKFIKNTPDFLLFGVHLNLSKYIHSIKDSTLKEAISKYTSRVRGGNNNAEVIVCIAKFIQKDSNGGLNGYIDTSVSSLLNRYDELMCDVFESRDIVSKRCVENDASTSGYYTKGRYVFFDIFENFRIDGQHAVGLNPVDEESVFFDIINESINFGDINNKSFSYVATDDLECIRGIQNESNLKFLMDQKVSPDIYESNPKKYSQQNHIVKYNPQLDEIYNKILELLSKESKPIGYEELYSKLKTPHDIGLIELANIEFDKYIFSSHVLRSIFHYRLLNDNRINIDKKSGLLSYDKRSAAFRTENNNKPIINSSIDANISRNSDINNNSIHDGVNNNNLQDVENNNSQIYYNASNASPLAFSNNNTQHHQYSNNRIIAMDEQSTNKSRYKFVTRMYIRVRNAIIIYLLLIPLLLLSGAGGSLYVDSTKTFFGKYTVYLDNNGGDGSTKSISVMYDQDMPKSIKAPTRKGYEFLGYFDKDHKRQYYTKDMESMMLWDNKAELVHNPWKLPEFTIYADWKIIEYTITLDANGGDFDKSQDTNIKVVFDGNMPDIIPPTRIGYAFVGMYDNVDLDIGKQYYDQDGKPTVEKWNKDADMTLYAAWVANKYKLTLDANGGYFNIEPYEINVIYDQDMPDINVPTRKEYNFVGMFDNKDYTKGKQYYTAQGIPFGKVKWDKVKDSILYAGWILGDDFIINLDPNGGELNNNSVLSVRNGQKLPDMDKLPTRTGYKFNGMYDIEGIQYYNEYGQGSEWDKNNGDTLKAKWTPKTYTVTLDPNAGDSIPKPTIIATFGQLLPSVNPIPTRSGYAFMGMFDGLDVNSSRRYIDSKGDSVFVYDIDNNITLYAGWLGGYVGKSALGEVTSEITDTLTIQGGSGGTYTVTDNYVQSTDTVNITTTNVDGDTKKRNLKYKKENNDDHNGSFIFTIKDPKYTEVSFQIEVSYSTKHHSCIATGTLITLSDGTQVPVEELKGDESLLVWDMYKGKYSSANIVFVEKSDKQIHDVINLHFSDGTIVPVIYHHAFWDFDLNRYVFIKEDDAERYIGHWFNKHDFSDSKDWAYERVQLVDVVVTNEITQAWSPVTFEHLNFYTNSMLSMPGVATGMINIFDVNPISMSYDKVAYESDIQKYGLFSYEEFSTQFRVPEIIFNAFGAKYWKVSIGKGLLTLSYIQYLVDRFKEFWE